ncbi:MAG: phosphate acetyltransferase [Actinobacteria bacterium]|nr:phosphate acetyltransferase [Actinomycetota bacterium]
MAKSILITSIEGHSGKSLIALGVIDALSRATARVGVFRPVTRASDGTDDVLEMLLSRSGIGLPAADCIGVGYDELHADPDAALGRILERFHAVEARSDAVVILGSDYTDVAGPAELGLNARIAANLGATVLLVLGGRDTAGHGERLGATSARTAAQLGQLARLGIAELAQERAVLSAIVVNRTDPDHGEDIRAAVSAVLEERTDDGADGVPVWVIPEDPPLVAPSVRGVLQALGGRLARGDEGLLDREVLDVVIAGMSMVNVLPRLIESSVVVIPADREEVLLATLLAQAAGTFPSIAAIVLNGPFVLPEPIERLLDGLGPRVPIIATDLGTYETTVRVMNAPGRLSVDAPHRVGRALALFEQHVDVPALIALLGVARSDVVTPLMFQYELFDRARTQRRTIVLPEGGDDRVLRAAGAVLSGGIADLVILGDEAAVRSRARELGVDLDAARIVSPTDPELVPRFAAEYARVRAHKGVTLAQAADTVTDVSYFGTLMVHLGLADGMVSGAAHTTAHTIRPAFEIIKTRPGVSVVSSVFLMALADRVLVYGDCAVIPDPTSEQLADIAISSAATATAFGIEPRVAMLSYSTGDSGSGAEVEKVRAATQLVRERAPELPVEGPIQYDAAADAAVARAKLPGSSVAGRATVFVFPDLNTGNNTYKAVQRSAGAVAMGPVLQGLNKPINDLSRGALVEDIVNTIAITAIQAQEVPA